MIKKIALILSVIFITVSCRNYPLPNCSKSDNQRQTIRWGEIDRGKNIKEGYELNYMAHLKNFKWELNSTEDKNKYSNIGYILPEKYCELNFMIRETMLTTQVLNEPGENTRFIEYSNQLTNTYFKAEWVPKFNTHNSRFFSVIYDSLMSVVNTAN